MEGTAEQYQLLRYFFLNKRLVAQGTDYVRNIPNRDFGSTAGLGEALLDPVEKRLGFTPCRALLQD